MSKVIFLHHKAFWRLTLVTGTSCEFESQVNCQARLYFLSCSALVAMTLQPLTWFTHVAFWRVASRLSLARSSHENPLNAHILEFFTLSHTQPLHYSHINTGYLLAKLQANLAWNKAKT